jgi:hypothetical protein
MSHQDKHKIRSRFLIIIVGIAVSIFSLITTHNQPADFRQTDDTSVAMTTVSQTQSTVHQENINGIKDQKDVNLKSKKSKEVHYNFMTSFFIAESKSSKEEVEQESSTSSKSLISRLAGIARLF